MTNVRVQAKKTHDLVEAISKKLKDVEDLARETKVEESRKLTKMTHEGVTANTVTLKNTSPLGCERALGWCLRGKRL
eukprot:2785772-Pyramimonas_sp.AAC.1